MPNETAKEKAEREYRERMTWNEGSLDLPKQKPKGMNLAEMDARYAEEEGEPLIESDGPTVHIYLPEEDEETKKP